MWSVTQLCRCTLPLRGVQMKLAAVPRSHSARLVTRQLLTPVRTNNLADRPGFQLSALVKSKGIVARLCSSAPKPESSKLVGYWLLGCSGMVFTAVVLGMVGGYLILIYSIYFVINTALRETNGSK